MFSFFWGILGSLDMGLWDVLVCFFLWGLLQYQLWFSSYQGGSKLLMGRSFSFWSWGFLGFGFDRSCWNDLFEFYDGFEMFFDLCCFSFERVLVDLLMDLS